MRPDAQFAVHKCTQFSAYPKPPHNKSVKVILKYLKGTVKQGIVLKTDIEKGIERW